MIEVLVAIKNVPNRVLYNLVFVNIIESKLFQSDENMYVVCENEWVRFQKIISLKF